MKIDVGTAYYPEFYDPARIRKDAQNMRDCSISLVRMGEFAWSHMEKEQGVYTLDFLEEAVNILGEYGIRSILCTPSSAAPAWMCRKYPQILRVNRQGGRAFFGVRDHTCYTSAVYRDFVAKIVQVLAERFKDNPHVAGWQIDNETGCSRFPECFCSDCQKAFRAYLKEKFKTLENLNKAWATPFWSGEFYDWEEIELDANYENMHSSRTLESFRFRSNEQASFIHFQADLIRTIMGQTVIGTNNYYGKADPYKAFAQLDYAGNDYYPSYGWNETLYSGAHQTFSLAKYAGYRNTPPWIMETPPGIGYPLRDDTSMYFYLFAAYGYSKVFYFLWSNLPNGNEKVHASITDSQGRCGVFYENIRKMIAHSDQIFDPAGELALPESECAVVQDIESSWIYCGSMTKRMEAWYDAFFNAYQCAFETVGFTRIVSSEADLSCFKLIIPGIMSCITKSFAEKLKKYVFEGGVVLLQGAIGSFDENGNHVDCVMPRHLTDLLGAEIHENRPCPDFTAEKVEDSADFYKDHVVVSGKLLNKEVKGTIGVWTAELVPTTAQTLLTFENSLLKGSPFCTVNSYGKGVVIYFAADKVNRSLYKEILRFAMDKASVRANTMPENVLKVVRGDLVFYINFSMEKKEFSADGIRGDDLLENAFLMDGMVVLEGRSAALFRTEK